MFNAIVVTDTNESNRSNAPGPSLAGRNPVYATTIRADPGIVLEISANSTTGSGSPINQQLSFFEKLRTTQVETDHKRSNILAWLYSINIIICPAGIGSYHIFGHPSYASIFIVLQLLGFLACVYHVFCFNLAMHHKRLNHTMSKHVIITIIQVAYVLLGMVLSFMVTRYCIFDIK